jgi:hypothetical protein
VFGSVDAYFHVEALAYASQFGQEFADAACGSP